MCQEAIDLSFQILKALSSWRCHIHELLAWRKCAPTLQETLGVLEENDGFNRIPNRVIRVFHDSDVPLVLDTLVCVDGLAKLFKKSKHDIIPSIAPWVDHTVRLFLEQTSKKRNHGDIDITNVFQIIENLKLQILEGRATGNEIAVSQIRSSTNLKFNVKNPASLIRLRKAAEELSFLCHLHPSKHTISSYICGHPGAVAPGVHKATRDLLHQLYIIQEVHKADEHLEKITDFSDMSLREREIEVLGNVQLNRANAVALQLANGAINCSHGGSLEPVFTALELFNGVSEKLVSVYKSQMIFLELRQTAMEGFEGVLDNLCRQAFIQAKVISCQTIVDVPSDQWVEEINGISIRPIYNFDCVFQKRSLCLALYDVDIQSALVDRFGALIKCEYDKIFTGLETTFNPVLITPCHIRIQILKASYDWLASRLPLSDWKTCIDDGERSLRSLSSVVHDCILLNLFHEFKFDTNCQRFMGVRQKASGPFSFKLCPRGFSHKIGVQDFRGRPHELTFGFEDICEVRKILSPLEIDQLVLEVQCFLRDELRQFLDIEMDALYEFLPLELIDLHPSDMWFGDGSAALDCASFIMEKIQLEISETPEWMEPLRSLEKIGNALIFLHFLQICIVQQQVQTCIQQSASLKDIGNLFNEVHDNGMILEPIDSGNPFEMEILRKKEEQWKEIQKPLQIEIMKKTIQMMKSEIEGREANSPFSMDTQNSFSAILFLLTYQQANTVADGESFGDGVLWATYLILQLMNNIDDFERCDWIHEIVRKLEMEELLVPNTIPDDFRSFVICAQRTTSVWKHISRMRWIPMDSASSMPFKGLKMIQDPPLKGFFGGIQSTQFHIRRCSQLTPQWTLGPLKASKIRNMQHPLVKSLFSE